MLLLKDVYRPCLLPEVPNESPRPCNSPCVHCGCRHELRQYQLQPDAPVDLHQPFIGHRTEWSRAVCCHRNLQRVAHHRHSAAGELGGAGLADVVEPCGLYSQRLPRNRQSRNGDLRSDLVGDGYDYSQRSSRSESFARHAERAHVVCNGDSQLPIDVLRKSE
jgi:hypothetical protein